MASIIKRPGKKGATVWQAQIRKKGYPSQIKTFSRKTDAVKWARKIEHEIEAGSWRDAKEASKITLSQGLSKYLETVTPTKRPATQESEKYSARSLKAEMGDLSLLQITPERVAEYRDERLKEVSPNSVRIELALLSSLFNIAAQEWSFTGLSNPVKIIKKPSIPEGRCPILSEVQIRHLIATSKESNSKLLYPFILLALHTGCRSTELRALRWSQVNLEDSFISLVSSETKGKRSRIVPLTEASKEILSELAEKAKDRYGVDSNGFPRGVVFPAVNDCNKPRNLQKAFTKTVKAAGLEIIPDAGKLRIHDLRHLCATFLIMNGADLETVREILGHRDLSTTQKYLHVINEHKKKAIDKIGNLGI